MGELRDMVHGVDFSAAADGGRKTWIASGRLSPSAEAPGRVQLKACRRACELPGSGPGRDEALAALREFLAGTGNCIVGMDFPFGLPAALVSEKRWPEFLRAFAERHADAAAFRAACAVAAGGRELKRATDIETRTPFSPYNLRLYRQTFHGLRDVLAPLVTTGRAAAAPMQAPLKGRPLLIEICPASTLKRAGLYAPYKGAAPEHGAARRLILGGLEKAGSLVPPPRTLRRAILGDPGGDALDSVVALVATARRAAAPGPWRAAPAPYAIEAMVHV